MKKINETILIVEDDVIVSELLETRLKLEGYNTLTAFDGIEALDAVDKNKNVSLLILDIMMPEMNGIEVLKKLRKSYNLLDLPILIVTAYDGDFNVINAFKEGANDYIKKPFEFSVLLRRLENHLFIKNANFSMKKSNIDLSNANLYLQEKLDKTLNIVQFSNRINNLNYDTLLNEAKRFFPILFEADYFSYFKYDSYKKRLKLIAHNHKKFDKIDTSFYIYENKGIMWDTIKNQKPLIIKNYSQSKYKDDNYFNGLKNISLKKDNAMCIPVIVENNITGVINLNNIKNEYMTQEHIATINIVINQFSLALNNALLHKKVEQLSILDDLTHLYNRRYFHRMIKMETDRIIKYDGNLTVLMIDIDHFKQFNDTYGHDFGDTILRETAKNIHSALRKVDISCRYGGEEFVVLLPNTNLNQAIEIAERIRLNIHNKKYNINSNTKAGISISLGLTEYKKGESIRTVLKRVDEALYESKRKGINVVTAI